EDWVLQTLNGHEVSEDSPEITLNFGATGQLTGTTGCNNYSGPEAWTDKECRAQRASALLETPPGSRCRQ
ncbi:MAG: META domain-containing protein, partial [Candidatus Electrothrix sp. GM3_4]|nr:META domain-containing protein [Candidatus Electrothrix sp. GM3_4]